MSFLSTVTKTELDVGPVIFSMLDIWLSYFSINFNLYLKFFTLSTVFRLKGYFYHYHAQILISFQYEVE